MAIQNYVTCKGKAIYPHLRTPDMFEGNDLGFTIRLMPSVEDAQKFEEFLLRELDKAAALPEFAGKRLNAPNALIGMSETKEGDTVFKFKTKSSYRTKSGDIMNRVVPIYDSQGKPLPKNVDIGHGSIVKVAFSIQPYYKTKTIRGLTLYLNAVQVLELVERGDGDAASFGFGAEEGGYVAPAVPNEDEDEIPFINSTEGADF
nr:MAG TPA: DNA helix destabilizing protein [Caudoviricetes sp.]